MHGLNLGTLSNKILQNADPPAEVGQLLILDTPLALKLSNRNLEQLYGAHRSLLRLRVTETLSSDEPASNASGTGHDGDDSVSIHALSPLRGLCDGPHDDRQVTSQRPPIRARRSRLPELPVLDDNLSGKLVL